MNALRPMLALTARIAAVAALALAWLAPAWWPPRALPPTVLLLDRSLSVPHDESASHWRARLAEADALRGPQPLTLAFASGTVAIGTTSADAQQHADVQATAGAQPDADAQPVASALRTADDSLDPSGTLIAAALDDALARLEPGRPAQLVLLSDLNATAGDTERALRDATARGVAIYVDPIAAAAAPAIAAVHAPSRARIGEQIAITVDVTDADLRRADVEVRLGDAPPVVAPATRVVALAASVERAGSQPLRVRLVDRASGEPIDALDPAAIVTVDGPPSLLYAGRGDAPLLAALRRGGWPVDLIAADDFESRTDFAPWRAVVLDDVPVTRPDAPAWRALDAAVREGGAGLIVLGGPRSFAAGGYHGTRLEALLPVTAEQARREDEAAVLFAIDKSGSMESATRGVDRLAYAREAARVTLQTLQPSDRAAVLGFDVVPGIVVPFDAADRVAARIDAAWTAAPSGGTRIAPALREAATLLAGEHAKRRLLVIVTDGFLAEEPIAAEIDALRRARVEVIAIAIGPDARVGELAKLIAPFGGEVLRVVEAAELPRLVRSSVAARRAPIALGRAQVRERAPVEFLAGDGDGDAPLRAWPAVEAYAITRARPGGRVALESAAGEPLLATQSAGRGRVAVLPAGLGAWTPDWMSWPRLPRFTCALAGWATGGSDSRSLAVAMQEAPDGLHVVLDAVDGAKWRAGGKPALVVEDPLGRPLEPRWLPGGPGRYEALVPLAAAGVYRLDAALEGASARREFLHSPLDERRRRGLAPQLADWERADLIQRLPEGGLAALVRADSDAPRPAPAWLAAALAAFVLAVLLDCGGVFRKRRAAR